MIRSMLAACLFVLMTATAVAAQPTIFLVRHAERADAGSAAATMAGADPDLSSAGRARADSLATLLKDARITAIYTTEYKRTHQTAAPLAKALGIEPKVIQQKDQAALAAKLEAASGNVLVVGHSNTLPEMIKSLGVAETVTIGDQDFDNLFIVTRGSRASLIRLHYR